MHKKKLINFLLILLLVVLIALLFIKINKEIRPFYKKKHLQTARRVEKPFGKKSFVVVIPSYNNEKYCERNLRSALDQKYDHFRVIYINDASKDNTLTLVKQILEEYGNPAHVTLIHNEVNQGAMANFYKAVHSCADHEIICALDGDDWFAHDRVLETLNHYYDNPAVWTTYGQHQSYPSGVVGMYAKAIRNGIFYEGVIRDHGWVTTHLKTFYAGLFKKVRKEDFCKDGKFLDIASDVAFMFPIIELARDHTFFVPDVLYIYNESNPISDAKMKLAYQEEVERSLRKLPRYAGVSQTEAKSFLQGDFLSEKAAR